MSWPFKLKVLSFHVLLPLVIGALVYIFFRAHPIIAFDSIFFISNAIHVKTNSNYCKVLIGSLPDFLWLYALLSFQIGIIWGEIRKVPKAILLIICILPIVTEILQYYQVIEGTGDYYDVIAYILAIGIVYNFQKNNFYVEEKSKLSI